MEKYYLEGGVEAHNNPTTITTVRGKERNNILNGKPQSNMFFIQHTTSH